MERPPPFKKIEVSSAGTGMDLLRVPDEVVFQAVCDQVPKISSIAFDWMKKRPLIGSGSLYSDGLSKVRKSIQKLSPWEREREFLVMAQNETVEFLTAVREGQSTHKIKLELGDILFSLLVTDQTETLLGSGYENIKQYKESPFRTLIPKLVKTLNSCTAEESLVMSVGLLNQSAGSIDASRLIDLNSIRDPVDDETFVELLNSDPIKNGIDLTFDLAFRYAALTGWNVAEVIKDTLAKNNATLPAEFFGSFSLFYSVSDTLSCLRMFRKYVFTKEKGSFKNQFSEKFLDMRKMWPIHPLGYEFRLWVSSLIDDVINDESIPKIDRCLMGELKKRKLVGEYPIWGSKHDFEPVSIYPDDKE